MNSQFDKLVGTNLIESDFFAFIEALQDDPPDKTEEPKRKATHNWNTAALNGQIRPFDVVLGNPPFLSELTEAATRVNKAVESVRGTLPDNQIAYLVAEQGLQLLAKDGRICMIQPAGLFYNEKARGFQHHLLKCHRIDYVLDFTSIRGLFDKADTKIVALVASKVTPPPDHAIHHLTFRRTFSVKEQIGFELDHYDRHSVMQEQALTAPHTWKVNLLGGGRLHHIAARMKEMGTLNEYIEKHGWKAGEGYIVGNQKNSAPWLTGQQLLPSAALTDSGIDRNRISTVTDALFEAHRPRITAMSPH